MLIISMIFILLLLISGGFDAVAETLKFHKSQFFKRYPKANPNFWDIDISWKNKWKNGDPAQGEKFWQSSRAFVFLTDGYHLSRMSRNLFNFLLITILVYVQIQLFSWYIYPIIYSVSYLSYTSGFSLIFDYWFKK